MFHDKCLSMTPFMQHSKTDKIIEMGNRPVVAGCWGMGRDDYKGSTREFPQSDCGGYTDFHM